MRSRAASIAVLLLLAKPAQAEKKRELDLTDYMRYVQVCLAHGNMSFGRDYGFKVTYKDVDRTPTAIFQFYVIGKKTDFELEAMRNCEKLAPRLGDPREVD